MKPVKKEEAKELIKVLRLIREADAYGWVEYEVPESALGEPISKSLPDIFAIFINTLIPKARQLFGI